MRSSLCGVAFEDVSAAEAEMCQRNFDEVPDVRVTITSFEEGRKAAGGHWDNRYILRPGAGDVFAKRGTNVALTMKEKIVDGVSVVEVEGRIVLGEETNAFREKINSLLAEGRKKILLNLDNVTLIDSTGLGTLVSAHHSAASRGASVRLCHLGTKFQEVLQITKLLTVFDVSDTEADGIRSFSK